MKKHKIKISRVQPPDVSSTNDTELFLNALENLDDNAIRQRKRSDESLPDIKPKTSRKETIRTPEIDLHGMTLPEAQSAVDQFLQMILRQAMQPTKLRIITGKGRHSGQGGSILARDIYLHVQQRYSKYIQTIDESPSDVKLGGLPIRGHFDVVVKQS